MAMENHPSYQALSTVLPKYPRAAGCLFQAYNDVLFGVDDSTTRILFDCPITKLSRSFPPTFHPAQQWTDVEVIDLQGCSRGAIKGRKPNTETFLHVVPCSLAETISFGWLQQAFSLLSDPPEIYLAITSEDASIVYYKISLGIVKPPV